MHTIASTPVSIRLQALAAMGLLLERLERLPRGASPEQYREVVRKVQVLLAEAEPGRELESLLSTLPATTELYENLHYGHSGLCRSPLDASLEAELAARASLAKSAVH
jgi:hypothetical protein